jgi:acyl-CoA carboxylase epsilon subunit
MSGDRPAHSGQNATPVAAPAAPAETGGGPFLSIVSGTPTAQEIAAVVIVLAGRARPAQEPGVGASGRSEWSARSRLVRIGVRAGPGAWRASALPR